MDKLDVAVLNRMVMIGITIANVNYKAMSVDEAIVMYESLCPDCKNLLRHIVDQGIYDDAVIMSNYWGNADWQTCYNKYKDITGSELLGTTCKSCEEVKKKRQVLEQVHAK